MARRRSVDDRPEMAAQAILARWQYRTDWLAVGDFEAQANEIGDEGWELFWVAPERKQARERATDGSLPWVSGYLCIWKRRIA